MTKVGIWDIRGAKIGKIEDPEALEVEKVIYDENTRIGGKKIEEEKEKFPLVKEWVKVPARTH